MTSSQHDSDPAPVPFPGPLPNVVFEGLTAMAAAELLHHVWLAELHEKADTGAETAPSS